MIIHRFRREYQHTIVLFYTLQQLRVNLFFSFHFHKNTLGIHFPRFFLHKIRRHKRTGFPVIHMCHIQILSRHYHRYLSRQFCQLGSQCLCKNHFRSFSSCFQSGSHNRVCLRLLYESQLQHHLFIQYLHERNIRHNKGPDIFIFRHLPGIHKFRTTQGNQSPGDRNFIFRRFCQRDPYRIANTFIQQATDTCCRANTTVLSFACFRNSQVQRIFHSFLLHRFDQQTNSPDHHPAITRFQRNHNIPEIHLPAHSQIFHRCLYHPGRRITITAHNTVRQ